MKTIQDIIKDIDINISTSILRSSKRTLLFGIKTKHYVPYDRLMKINRTNLNKKQLDILNTIENIHTTYRLLNIPESEYRLHWEYNYQKQKLLHLTYNNMIKPPRQDNKTYINYGNGRSFRGKMRVPFK